MMALESPDKLYADLGEAAAALAALPDGHRLAKAVMQGRDLIRQLSAAAEDATASTKARTLITDTKPQTGQSGLSVRLRNCQFWVDVYIGGKLPDGLLDEAADALDAKDALLSEAAEALRGLIHVRDKAELGRARSLLLKLTEATKP